jgi:nucleotide-binding universal stress UspA family protein
MFKRVLVAVDDSAAGNAAYDTAADLARDLHASLTAITVADKSQLPAAQALLEACRKRNTVKGVEPEMIVREGSPADAIREATGSMRWDVLVIGTRGRQGVSRVLVGSVAEKLLHSSEIPVLVVRRS